MSLLSYKKTVPRLGKSVSMTPNSQHETDIKINIHVSIYMYLLPLITQER